MSNPSVTDAVRAVIHRCLADHYVDGAMSLAHAMAHIAQNISPLLEAAEECAYGCRLHSDESVTCCTAADTYDAALAKLRGSDGK